MMKLLTGREIVLHDYCVDADTFLSDVTEGLSKRPRRIPSKYFYDARGSKLFDEITELDAYYPTRTELAIMARHMPEIATGIGPAVHVIEYGSGSSQKTRLLIDHLQRPVSYTPIDISREHLMEAARGLADAYPDLEILPVCADYTQSFPMPTPSFRPDRVLVFFPGSTIGNMTPEYAARFLRHARTVGDSMLLGVDLVKDRTVLEAAYNDAEGVTSAFNLNMLHHMKERLGATVDVDGFRHTAFFNAEESRIEMHLVAESDQTIEIGNDSFQVPEGESICTEYSYKYTPETLAALAEEAGYRVDHVWTDDRAWFGLFLLTSEAAPVTAPA